MDKKQLLDKHPDLLAHFEKLNELNIFLESNFLENYNRSLPLPDHINDRWDRAERLGFGKGTNIYDSSYIIGDVKVGENCWIGMFTILDGSGGLSVGNYCTISAGVHIYSHSNVKQTLTSGKMPIERLPVKLGNNCYIGPQSIITMGVCIGNNCVVGSNTLVNKNLPDNSIVVGNPAKIIGKVVFNNGNVEFVYDKV